MSRLPMSHRLDIYEALVTYIHSLQYYHGISTSVVDPKVREFSEVFEFPKSSAQLLFKRFNLANGKAVDASFLLGSIDDYFKVKTDVVLDTVKAVERLIAARREANSAIHKRILRQSEVNNRRGAPVKLSTRPAEKFVYESKEAYLAAKESKKLKPPRGKKLYPGA